MIKFYIFASANKKDIIESYFNTQCIIQGAKCWIGWPVLPSKILSMGLKEFAQANPTMSIWVKTEKETIKLAFNGVSNIRVANYPEETIFNREGLK